MLSGLSGLSGLSMFGSTIVSAVPSNVVLDKFGIPIVDFRGSYVVSTSTLVVDMNSLSITDFNGTPVVI